MLCVSVGLNAKRVPKRSERWYDTVHAAAVPGSERVKTGLGHDAPLKS